MFAWQRLAIGTAMLGATLACVSAVDFRSRGQDVASAADAAPDIAERDPAMRAISLDPTWQVLNAARLEHLARDVNDQVRTALEKL